MINICVATNKKALYPVYVLLTSITVNNPCEAVRVYLLHSELELSDYAFLEGAFNGNPLHEIEFTKIRREDIPDLPCNSFWSIEAYYRLLLVDLLPREVDRILYLDIDMIVNKNLKDFYDTDFEGKSVIVSRDMEFDNILAIGNPDKAKHKELFTDLIEQGLVYFCSGMILFNVEKLRKDGMTFKKYIEVFEEKKEYFTLFDQDLLNYVHWQDAKYVDNLIYGIFAPTAHTLGYGYETIKENAVIIHFTGMAKPWTVNLLRYDIEKIWWEYAKLTPFYHDLMERVFFNMMESTFTEGHINRLLEENASLKDMLLKFQEIMKKL